MRSVAVLAVSALALAAAAVGAGPVQAAPAYRDLNHNGQLDPYENPALSDEARVDDLLARMTLEEQVGTMLHATLPTAGAAGSIGAGQTYDEAGVRAMIAGGITSAITRLNTDPAAFAAQNNRVQEIAAQSRLGIPVTISSDPRNHFQGVIGAASAGGKFSQWPEPLGFAAIGDPALVESFGRHAAAEYRAVGMHMALSPQADLYTEPRWSRGNATFGSDPTLVSALAGAYVRGFQGGATGLARGGVATVVKHWVGYGAEPEGFDAHNEYGRVAVLDNASFALHVAAFRGAFAAGAAGVMPTYPIIAGVTYNGQPLPHVGAGFNAVLLQDMLRKDMGYRGLVVSDWSITADCNAPCRSPSAAQPQTPRDIATSWGVEGLTAEDRFALGANAGIDQFGGVNDPAPLLAAVRAGKISRTIVAAAARRALLVKFQLGLFDQPMVDPARTARVFGDPKVRAEADAAQRAAQVVLENHGGLLPLAPARRKVWLYGVAPAAAEAAGFAVVAKPELAEVAIVRVGAPYELLHPHNFFGSRQHEGRLDFAPDSPAMQAVGAAAAAHTALIVAVDLDRPAILTQLREQAGALIGVFGASDAALLDVITGKARPRGRLPLELPRSMAAVADQDPARPDDSRDPLYPRGYGLDLPTR